MLRAIPSTTMRWPCSATCRPRCASRVEAAVLSRRVVAARVRGARGVVPRRALASEGSALTMRLLLFDVDGTLVRCGKQVRVLFAEALREVFGTHGDLDSYEFSGK